MDVSATSKPCAICGTTAWEPAYEGPIRDGVFGRERPGRIVRCRNCSVEVLQEPREAGREYYADGTYRTDVGEKTDAADFFARHDHEQFSRLALLERVPLRGRVVADIGCGGGSFLDGIAGYASKTLAIEPARNYHESLTRRGHQVYADTSEALRERAGKVDVAVCFSVIEHMEDPVALLSDIRAMLSPTGIALVSTPNRDDVLLAAGCEAYRRFFYRVVHLYYFEATSIRRAAAQARFGSCELVYQHRFPFSNFVGWLREGRPTGSGSDSLLGSGFDRIWHATLETSGRADYLYAYLTP